MKVLLLVVLTFVCSGFAQTFEVGGIAYNILSSTDKTVQVTSKYPKYIGSVTIPTTVAYNTIIYAVKAIGSQAFCYCTNLTSVTIPSSVAIIGDWAFAECSSLTNVTIPNSVTTIGDWVFINCSSLTIVMIPNSVTTIGGGVFVSCSVLASIEVGISNPNYSSLDGVLYNKSRTVLLQYPGGKNGDFDIPNSVITIGHGAFAECSSLTSVTIPNSVTAIGDWSFINCIGLASITSLAVTPPSLGRNVFEYVPTSIPLYVPSGSIATYQATAQWNVFNITPGLIIEDNLPTPNTSTLSQNYPNPFNPTTSISYSLSAPDLVRLSVYNSKGETVQTLINSMQIAGTHNISFDGSKLNSGIYFYKLEANGKSIIHKMMLVK